MLPNHIQHPGQAKIVTRALSNTYELRLRDLDFGNLEFRHLLSFQMMFLHEIIPSITKYIHKYESKTGNNQILLPPIKDGKTSKEAFWCSGT